MSNIKLRDYQEAAVNDVRAAFRAKNDPVLFVLPTGGGKTYSFSYIADNAAKAAKSLPQNEYIFIIVHRKELLLQASASLRNLGVDHGLISPHFTPQLHKRIQVASIDTLLIRIKKRPMKARMVIFDEAHHVVSDNKWGRTFEELGKPPTLGVTATPVRTDGKGLGDHAGGIFKAMVLGPSIAELIERKMLLNPVVYTSLEQPDLSGLKTNKDGDYNNKELAERVDKPVITGSALEQYKKVCPGARAIVFCASIEHARHVVAEFNAAGFRFSILVGEPAMSDAERTAVNKALRSGELDGACTVDLVSEGYDLPDLECCIMLRPTASESLFIQQVGRVMRPSDGKTTCFLLDHVGNVGKLIDGEFKRKHGLPNEVREWTLDGRVKKKGKRKAEEKTIDVSQCPKCYIVHEPSPACPKCGHVYEIKARNLEQVEGELVKITPEMAAQISKEKQKEVKNAKTLAELERIAAERGYSPKWAKMTFETRARTRAKYQPQRPPEPSIDELKQMTLLELENVANAQGWPVQWASTFYHQNRGAAA